MKKILFVVDKKGWAYDDAAQNWKSLLKNKYDIDILYLAEYEPQRLSHSFNRLIKEYQSCSISGVNLNPKELIRRKDLFLDKSGTVEAPPVFDHSKYDLVYFFYHRAMCDSRLYSTPIPFEKIAVAINNEKWAQTGADIEYDMYMRGAKQIVACNNHIIKKFKPIHNNILKVSQTINEKVFFKDRGRFCTGRRGDKFTVGWSGNYANKIKNFDTVKAACLKAGVKLVKARDLNRKQLNEWYNQLDAVLCASSSEGGPLMLLEAGAVGIPVITTKVGLAREIIIDGHNGKFVDWNINSMAAALRVLAADTSIRGSMGKNLQKEVLSNWTYKARIDEITKVIERF